MEHVVNYYPSANSTGKTFDDWVAELNTQKNGEVFFVEIGAMDGLRHDALYKHIVANPGWSGVFVEPLTDMFRKLTATYKERDNVLFENVAVAERDGTTEIARIPEEKVGVSVPDWADGISTLKPSEHILGQDESLKQHMVKETVTTMTFETLVRKHSIAHVDLFQSDTEGYDKIIFDHMWQAGFRPSIIKLEINYMYYHVIRSLFFKLTTEGYECFYQDDDMVAVKL